MSDSSPKQRASFPRTIEGETRSTTSFPGVEYRKTQTLLSESLSLSLNKFEIDRWPKKLELYASQSITPFDRVACLKQSLWSFSLSRGFTGRVSLPLGSHSRITTIAKNKKEQKWKVFKEKKEYLVNEYGSPTINSTNEKEFFSKRKQGCKTEMKGEKEKRCPF